MNTTNIMIVAACAGLLASCAATVPKELVNARAAYQRASTGPAAKLAPAELHLAHDALAKAEQAFATVPDSYQTKDLAYIAQRKAQIAAATAAIAIEKEGQAAARSDYQTTQGEIVAKTKEDLTQARADLAASEQSGKTSDRDLAQSRTALAESERSGASKEWDLTETRAALAESERSAAGKDSDLAKTRSALASSQRSGAVTAERLSAEKLTRVAAEKRAAAAQAALLKLAAVKDEPRGLVITLSGSVLFASNQTVLLPEARSRLDQVAAVLLTTRERNVTVEGFTDSQGAPAYNLDLSQRRADAVRDYLVKAGYEADRISAHGLGELRSIADNGNAEGRANNRRVEIIIDPDGPTASR